MCVFAMLAALMFCSKLVMAFLPNIHLLGALTMVYTLVFRTRALIPIYICSALVIVTSGFHPLVLPYFYVWAVLWGVTMLLPKKMPRAVAAVVYPVVCALHGLFFGVLCAPAQALFFGLGFKETLAWIASGATFDIVHMIGNFAAGFLILPLSAVLKKLTMNR